MTNISTLDLLRSEEKFASWLDYLEELGPPSTPIVLPDGEAFLSALNGLDVPTDDVGTLVALRSELVSNVDLWWMLERAVHSLLLRMDRVDSPPGFQPLPSGIGPIAPFFYVYVYVVMLPHAQELHHRHSISEEISRATMADIGRNMLVHRKRHGTHGLAAPDWLTLHLRGMIYQLGRLQFERAKIGTRTGDAIAAANLPYSTEYPCLSVHIPDFMGSMTEAACDVSFARAQAFFPEHFPDEDYYIAVCNSWLLDEQLRDYLSAGSNVLKFQQRFREIRAADWNNDGPLRFVFGPTETPLDELPQTTSVQRAVVEHIKAGRTWHGGMGWLEL
ncbi:MAG: acyltransferase domain-containing protein [Thermomicrobiales bacterium]